MTFALTVVATCEAGDVSVTVAGPTVVIRFLSALSDRVGIREEILLLPMGSTLRTIGKHLLEQYGLTVPDDDIFATLNGLSWQQTPLGLCTPLADGDIIHLFPPIGGG